MRALPKRWISECTGTHHVTDLEQAVLLAKEKACARDVVLLSPACASFDMFDNFEHRGNCYMAIVEALLQK